MNVILIGMPGSGKSTVGVVLAKLLGLHFCDTDLVLQQHCGKKLQEIIRTEGDAAFFRHEEEVLAALDVQNTVIATGGSADAAIAEMKKRGCKNIKLMVLVAAPEGINCIQEKHPDVDVYVGAVDSHLNEHGYIVPGLGDAGDRIFGTK